MMTMTRNRGPEGAAAVGDRLDRAGVAVSCLCALHCALLPSVAAALPMLGMGLLAEEGTEMALMGTSAAIGTIGLGLGFRRHGSGRALALLAVGLGLLALGRLAEARGTAAFGPVAVVAGGLAIAGGHRLNRRLCRACPACREVGPTGRGDPAPPASPAGGDARAGEARR